MTETTLHPSDLKRQLNHFIGTEQYFKHPLSSAKYTDGVKFFIDNGGTNGAYWLLDLIAIEGSTINEPLQVWKVLVENEQATIRCEDGNDAILFTKELDYTDLQEGMWTFYFTNGVILLPSEY